MTDELPRRTRRRLVTPLTAVLAFALVAVLGFIGGVQVQKSQGTPTTGGGAGAAGFARGGFQLPQTSQQQDDSTQGTVKNVNGSSLYVTDQSGTVVHVKTGSNTKVTRTAVSSAKEIHPGDSVVVQGSKASSGTVKATSVTATAKNANGGQ